MVEWRPSGLQCALGEWERHTTVRLSVNYLYLGIKGYYDF